MKRILNSVFAGLLILGTAHASTIAFNLTDIFSTGSAVPSLAAPWGRATFSDSGANAVTLTLEALNLAGTEFISGWYFNLSPFPTPLTITPVTELTGTTVKTGEDGFKADGDGYYDIWFNFLTAASGARFQSGMTLVYTFQATGLDAMDFLALSQGSPNKSYYTAAHIQGINGDPAAGAWVKDDPVPEGGPLLLMGGGMVVIGALRHRIRKRTTARLA